MNKTIYTLTARGHSKKIKMAIERSKQMKLHLCCNQLKHAWEVRNEKEEVIFEGALNHCELFLNIRGQMEVKNESNNSSTTD